MGGSQREEDYTKLVRRMTELGMKEEDMKWYLNLRRFGGCVHSGLEWDLKDYLYISLV